MPANFRVRREDQSLRSMTVSTLRRAIFSLHISPGTRVTERKLCDLTGVSRSLMREALRDLEAQGLISNVPHRSRVIATITPKDAQEIYEIRCALEPMAARLFVERASEDQVWEIEERADVCRQAMEKHDVLEVIEALDNFYSMLFSGAGNRMAAMLARNLYTKAGLLRALTFQRQEPSDTKQSMAHIRRIASAIRERDADAAAEACVTQVKRSWKVAMRLLRPTIEASAPKKRASLSKSQRDSR